MALDFPSSPSNGQIYTSDNIVWEYETSTTTWNLKQDGVAGTTKVALLKDQKNYDVAGGTFTTGAWRDRDLTVEEDPQSFVNFTIGGSQTTYSGGNTPGYWSLPAGTYRIKWSAPGQAVDNHVSLLVWSTTEAEISTAGLDGDITTAGTYTEGSSTQCHEDVHSTTFSSGSKVITTTAAATWFKLLHRCGQTNATDGFGTHTGIDSSIKNIYTQVRIEDLTTAVKEDSTGAQNGVFWENDISVSKDYTITDGKNAMSAGPLEIASGITVTVPSGSAWTVV